MRYSLSLIAVLFCATIASAQVCNTQGCTTEVTRTRTRTTTVGVQVSSAPASAPAVACASAAASACNSSTVTRVRFVQRPVRCTRR